jgi:hypothetical protein
MNMAGVLSAKELQIADSFVMAAVFRLNMALIAAKLGCRSNEVKDHFSKKSRDHLYQRTGPAENMGKVPQAREFKGEIF